MDRAALRQEIKDLGHNYGDAGWDARLNRFLNFGAKDVLLDELWPQRRQTVTTTPGTTIPRLGPIKGVAVTSTQFWLAPTTIDELRDDFPGPFTSGVPLRYYVVRNQSLGTWPTSSGSIDVDHYDRACWTDVAGTTFKVEATTDSDLLLGGDVFEEAVILATRLRVLEDTDENELRTELQVRLRGQDGYGGVMLQLRDRQLLIQSDEPQRIKQTREWV